MKPQTLSTLWAELIIEELVRFGAGPFCISPGSRNSVLTLAAAANDGAETVVHFDERGAGYYAVGTAKASGRSAVLICTSGTAVANYLPAVVEASQSSVPLFVLTADRPAILRGTGANQTIDQVEIFGPYVRGFHDLPTPRAEYSAAHVLTTVDELVYRGRQAPVGPVHCNCQLPEPFVAAADLDIPLAYQNEISGWRQSGEPLTSEIPPTAVPGAELDRVRDALAGSRRGVLVAGRLDPQETSAVAEMAARLDLPLLADVTSGLRFVARPLPGRCSCYDLYLREQDIAAVLQPDLIVQFGGPLVSRSLQHYLERAGAEYLHIASSPFRRDPGEVVTQRIELSPSRLCAAWTGVDDTSGLAASSELLNSFRCAEAACAGLLTKVTIADDLQNELTVAGMLLQQLPAESGLFLGNSMPIRDAEACGVSRTDQVTVGCNRGASGIDGTMASAVGFAAGLQRRTTLLLGDLAFLHDLNSLALVRRSPWPVTVVVINNDGGGIFSFLPVAQETEHFEEFFAVPHGLDVEPAATLFDLPYYQAASAAELRAVVDEAFGLPHSSVVEIKTEQQTNHARHCELWEQVAAAVRAALS
ncbi:MAG: 2-succinyl-5-enolpyruvyl-6-hydroxy-3-cyclohexene-1-carboxylic-acid synthase [bacterium]